MKKKGARGGLGRGALPLAFLMAFSLVALALQDAHAAPNDLLVIANRSVEAKQISHAALKQIFLRQRSRFGGMRVVPINARDRTQERRGFRHEVLKMSRAEETRYWQEYRIRHGGRPPAEFRNVLKAVFKIRGAIGYVSRAHYREGVARILLVLPASEAKR